MSEKIWDTEKLFKEGFNTLPNEYIGWVQRQRFSGKFIQCKEWNDKGQWSGIQYPGWHWETFMYRVAPEEPKKLMTKRQLAEWLARGNGEWISDLGNVYSGFKYDYRINESNKEVNCDFRVRRWKSVEWIKPTLEVYEKDCK